MMMGKISSESGLFFFCCFFPFFFLLYSINSIHCPPMCLWFSLIDTPCCSFQMLFLNNYYTVNTQLYFLQISWQITQIPINKQIIRMNQPRLMPSPLSTCLCGLGTTVLLSCATSLIRGQCF